MRNVFLIIKHEISTTLRKRSFWLTTFLLPAVILAMSLGSQALARSSMATGGSNPLLGGFMSAGKPIGYVDLAGVIEQIPEPPQRQSILAELGRCKNIPPRRRRRRRWTAKRSTNTTSCRPTSSKAAI